MKTPELNEQYWTGKYIEQSTGWDLGALSPPIKDYADQLTNKELSILIPGAGNAYEAEYLFKQGFKKLVVLDVSLEPLKNFQKRIPEFQSEQLIHQNFFDHQGQYDLIIEQTFFCALSPSLRERYAEKMYHLLGRGGKLAGVLFDFPLTEEGPPFGGSREAYVDTFSKYFRVKTLDRCFNSVKPRLGRELFIIFEKKN
jgi:hypothetical protein